MSMYKIARFLKVNGGLYGAQNDEERYMSLPLEGPRYRYDMLSIDRSPAQTMSGYKYVGDELGSRTKNMAGTAFLG
ncbi:MAG: hypothetical protein AAF492_05330 [Verrucomicrobiota bacterium]